MCNCSKPITQTECEQLREFHNDPQNRTFIYQISDNEGLRVAYVPKGANPNKIALQRGFFNAENQLEWFHVSEHPCINENI